MRALFRRAKAHLHLSHFPLTHVHASRSSFTPMLANHYPSISAFLSLKPSISSRPSVLYSSQGKRTLPNIRLVHQFCIKALRSNIYLVLKWSMGRDETLGLENLGLGKVAVPPNASRVEKEASLQSGLQKDTEEHTPSITSMLPTYQSLNIAPFFNSADILHQWPSQDGHHQSTQTSAAIPRYHPAHYFLSEYYHDFIQPSTISRETTVPCLQTRLCFRGSEATGQNFTPLLEDRALSSSPVHNQNRHSKAKPPLTEAALVPHGGWRTTSSASPQQNLFQESRPSDSVKSKILEVPPTAPWPSISDSKDDLIFLPPPSPTKAYLITAHIAPNLLPGPKRLLLVLDLNGTLIYRHQSFQTYTPRPFLRKFLKYAFANHSLLVWSSARPHNVKGICARLFSRDQRQMLLGEWGRDTFGLTSEQYNKRVSVRTFSVPPPLQALGNVLQVYRLAQKALNR